MNLRNLRTFVTVAEAGGFSKALARIHLSQPAASRQIHALEEELGLALFDRVSRGLRLTPAGESLLHESRLILSQADALHERARALKAGDAGLLRVGATPQTIANLAAFLQTYTGDNPQVDVQLVEDGGARLPDRLANGDIDLAITPMGDDRFRGRLLYPLHTFAVLPRKHRWSRLPVLDIKLMGSERLMVGSGFGSRVLFEAACELAHVRPRLVLESSAPHTLVALVRTGFGIAVLPSPAVVGLDGVRVVPLVHRGSSIGRWLTVLWSPQRFLAPYAERFVDGLVKHHRKTFPAHGLIRRAPPLPTPQEDNLQL